jgi:uncharacterized protein YbbK (DUF523 family)
MCAWQKAGTFFFASLVKGGCHPQMTGGLGGTSLWQGRQSWLKFASYMVAVDVYREDLIVLIVSACLAGVECRYNGQAFPIPVIVELVKKGQALPVCPEILGKLPTPRPCAERCGEKVVTKNGQNITAEVVTGAWLALQIAQLVGCKAAILKAKSPTCGCGLIYDGTFSGKLVAGDGIFCSLLKEKKIKVFTENDIENREISLEKLVEEL